MSLRSSCDFSFSGLKSAVRLLLDSTLPAPKRAAMSEAEQQAARADVAASFQRVAVEHLAERTARAHLYPNPHPNPNPNASPNPSPTPAPALALALALALAVTNQARALQWAKDAEPSLSCLVVAGGVAANQTVR